MDVDIKSGNKKPSICFVAPTAYPLISGDPSIKIVGGAELQQALLARALAERGYSVTMICMNHGQENIVEIDGVKIYSAYSPGDGLPVLRFLYPRLTTIWSCMKAVSADVYYQRAVGMLTGIVALFCQVNKKISIYAGASNLDFVRKTPKIRYKRDRLLFEYGLRNIDRIIVQNTEQQYLVNEHYRRPADIIPNGYSVPHRATNSRGGCILWVSTIAEVKRPLLFLKLAQSLPNYRFVMIGGKRAGQECLFHEVECEAKKIDNLEFMGFLPFAEADNYFNCTRLVINTSESEGFPNTFLQAWSREIPTVSYFDCGARSKGGAEIGCSVDSIDEMQSKVDQFMSDDELWEERGRIVNDYFETNHSIENLVSNFVRVALT